MNLKWRWPIVVVSGLVAVQGPVLAIDCEEMTRTVQAKGSSLTYSNKTVEGQIYPVKSHEISPAQVPLLSEQGMRLILQLQSYPNPFVVLIENDTSKVYDFRLMDEGEGVELLETAQLTVRWVRVTGCTDGNEYLLANLSDVRRVE